jgi:hypothetical protein
LTANSKINTQQSDIMNTTNTMDSPLAFQTARAAIREAESSIPPVPDAQFQRLALQYLQALPRRDRGRCTLLAVGLGGVSVCAVAAWIMTASGPWLLLGAICLFAALLSALWLVPARLETLICQIQREYHRLQEAYAAECLEALKGALTNVIQALKADAVGAVQSGSDFQKVRDSLVEFIGELESETGQNVATLESLREELTRSTEETERLRRRLAATSSGLASRFLPLYRREARALLHSIKAMHERACKCERLDASLKLVQALSNEARRMQANINLVLNLDLTHHQIPDQVGSAMGSPLPTRKELENQARQRMDRNLTEHRSRVLVNLFDGNPPLASVEESVDGEFAANPGWAATVPDYVKELNGNLGSFAQVFWLEANEQLPVKTKPGKLRFRVALLIGPSSTSPCFQTIARRCRDVATIGSTEHCPEELLAIPVEVNLTIGEVPELASIIEEFRALPVENQRKLITATPFVDDLLNWFPERSQRSSQADGLLDSAVAMEIVKRDGSGQVMFNGELIAKGYSAARNMLAENPDLSAKIADALRAKCDSLGSSEVLRLLLKAKEACPVPSAETAQFRAHLDDEIARLSSPEGRMVA